MKSIPASVVFLGVAALCAASIAGPATVSAADLDAPSKNFSQPYARYHEDSAGVVVVKDDSDPYRYTRERIWPGHGGAKLEHHFGYHPDDPERPRYRKYYPYVWGGYAFSAPYFVNKHDYSRPEYDKPYYGKAQKYRWGRDYKRPDVWEDGRW
jgi:hypothetical protein